jgi:SAM-dependent methyltransferase
MGYFTIPLCVLVGSQGKVIAVDIQQRMLDALLKRARRAGVADRLETRLGTQDGFVASVQADFVLAFWMVHEVPDQVRFLSHVMDLMKPGSRFLLAEPGMHVTKKRFDETVWTAKGVGLVEEERPRIAFSRCVLFSSQGIGPVKTR